MGDVLVKSRADSEAEKRAEAAASFEDKEDARGLPTPLSRKTLPTFKRTYTDEKGRKRTGDLKSLVQRREKARTGRDLRREFIDAVNAEDDVTANSIRNEVDELVYAELDDDERQQVADIMENNRRYEQHIRENQREEEDTLPSPGIGVPEAAEKLGINLPSKEESGVGVIPKKRSVKVKPKLGRKEGAIAEDKQSLIDELKGKLKDARTPPAGSQIDIGRVQELKDRIKELESDPTAFVEEGRLQQVAEMQGLDWNEAQKKARAAIKDLAVQRGIPIPPPGALRGFGPMKMNPEYKKLLDENYKRILGDIVVGKEPTALMRVDDEFDTLEEAIASGKRGAVKEIPIRPTEATSEELEEEITADEDPEARKRALVAIRTLTNEKEKAEAAGDSDKVAVLSRQIEEAAEIFPNVRTRPAFGQRSTGETVRERVIREGGATQDLMNEFAEEQGRLAMESGQKEIADLAKLNETIDRLQSQVNEPYIMAGDGEGNINPIHALYIKTRRRAQQSLENATLRGDQAGIEEAKNALVALNQRLEEGAKKREERQQVASMLPDMDFDPATVQRLEQEIEDAENQGRYDEADKLIRELDRIKNKEKLQESQLEIRQLEQRLREFRNSDSAREEKQRFAEYAKKEIEEQGLSIRDSEGNLTPEYIQLFNSKLKDTEEARLERELNELKSSQKLPSAQGNIMRNVPDGLGGIITQTPQGLDIRTDIAEPVSAREFFRRQINPGMTAGGRRQGQRGTGQNIGGGLPAALKKIARVDPSWDFTDDPIFMQTMESLGIDENDIPSIRNAPEGMTYVNPRIRSDVRGLTGMRRGRDRLSDQNNAVLRAQGEAAARFMANYVSTPEGAKELLGPEYATFSSRQYPLLGNPNYEKALKRLQKLKAKRFNLEALAARRDPEKIAEIQEKQERDEAQKQEAMIKRYVQRLAEMMAITNNQRMIVSGRMPGLGQGGKTIQDMKEEQMLLREIIEAGQNGNRRLLRTLNNRLVNKYGYSRDSLDPDMLERRASALEGTIEHLSNERERLIADVDSRFRDTMIQMQARREGARGQRPDDYISVPDKLPSGTIGEMEAQKKVAEERGDIDLAEEIGRRIDTAKEAQAGGDTMSELEAKLRRAEASGNQTRIDKILSQMAAHRKDITTFTGMGDKTRTRTEYPEAPPAVSVGSC